MVHPKGRAPTPQCIDKTKSNDNVEDAKGHPTPLSSSPDPEEYGGIGPRTETMPPDVDMEASAAPIVPKSATPIPAPTASPIEERRRAATSQGLSRGSRDKEEDEMRPFSLADHFVQSTASALLQSKPVRRDIRQTLAHPKARPTKSDRKHHQQRNAVERDDHIVVSIGAPAALAQQQQEGSPLYPETHLMPRPSSSNANSSTHSPKSRPTSQTPQHLPRLGSVASGDGSRSLADGALMGNMSMISSASDNGSFAKLERRQMASIRNVTGKSRPNITINDLVIIVRVASLDAPFRTEQVNTKLVTHNYGLGWIYDLRKRPKSRDAWKNLRTMRTDYLESGGGKQDPEPLIDSPRSVLTLCRNGKHPMALQKVPFESLRSELSIQGLSSTDIKSRHEFLETFRKNELDSLQREYDELCKVLPFEEMMVFFELIDPMGGMVQLPRLEWNDDLGHYTVEVSTDDALANAMQKMNERMDEDRLRVRKMLRVEIEGRERLVELHEQEQQKNLQAADRHQRRAIKQAEEKRQEAMLRKMASEMKTNRLIEAKREAEEIRLREIAIREERARQVEAAAAVAAKEKREKHRRELEAKQERRKVRMEQSAFKTKKLMEEREAALEEKDRFRQEQIERKHRLVELRKQEHEIEMEQANQRRKEIVARSEAFLRERELKARAVQAKVEARLEDFAEQKKVAAQLRQLEDLRREIRREEVALEARAIEEQRIEAQIAAKERQMERYHHFKAHQNRDREVKQEQTKQVNVLKETYVERRDFQREFAQLAVADKQIREVRQAETLESSREVMVEKARAERAALAMYRKSKLEATSKDIEEKERHAFFTMFNRKRNVDTPSSKTGGGSRSQSRLGHSLSATINSTVDSSPRILSDPGMMADPTLE